jgi:hypothetical protein
MALESQNQFASSNSTGHFFSSLISRPGLLAPVIFVATTLILGLAGRGVAFVREDVMMIDLFRTYPFHLARVFTDGWVGLYGNNFPWIDWSYRPLEMMIDWTVINLFGESETLQIIFKSAIVGLSAMLIYLVVRQLAQKRVVAIASALFSAFSVPLIIESWWYHHMAAYAEVAILLGFLGYLRYIRLQKLRWLMVFWVCSLAAPLLGEYGISLPLTVLLSSAIDSVIKRKANWKVPVSSLVLVLLAVFPAFLPNLVIGHRVVLTSVFERFIPALSAGQGLFNTVQAGAPYLLIAGALTPVLTLLAFVSLVIHFVEKRKAYPTLVMMGFVCLCILALVFTRNHPPPTTSWGDLATMPFEAYYVLPTLLPLLFALLSYRLNKFIVLWFIVAYVPFLKIYHLSVNLLPALIPWTIILCLWIAELAEKANMKSIFQGFRFTPKAVVPVVFLVVLTVGMAAQISNVAIAEEGWGKAANNERGIGEFADRNIPENSLILGEQQSLFEVVAISYYSHGKVKGNLAVYDQYMWWPLKQITAAELPGFLEADSTYPEKYFLIQERVPQVLFNYLRFNPGQFQLVTRFDVKARIILIDPLYLILPKDVPYFMGLNMARIYPTGGRVFSAEFTGDYALYQYTGGSPEEHQRPQYSQACQNLVKSVRD